MPSPDLLEISLDLFRVLFENAPSLYLVLEPEEFRIIAVSEAYLAATMTRRDDIIGKKVFEVFPDDPGDPFADGVRNLRASLERVKSDRRADAMAVQRYPIRRPESEGGQFEMRWWSSINSPIFDDRGKLTYIVHRVEDVTRLVQGTEEGEKTDKKMLESHLQRMQTEILLRGQDLQRVNERLREQMWHAELLSRQLSIANSKLEISNKALQDFAVIASHDLQEPVRKILTFTQRLSQKFAAQLPEEAQDYITRVISAGYRMQRLIDDLLTYSRVTSKGDNFCRTDLNTITAEVLSDMEMHINATHADILVDELPIIEADPSQMRQLLQNLISNALKYSKEYEPPQIRIAARRDPQAAATDSGHIQLRVQDNGVGFDEKYLDRIFNAFQRLESASEHEGTGMGLAICKRIAEHHGGSITAHSKIGEGSTFVVTLPTHQKADETHAQ